MRCQFEISIGFQCSLPNAFNARCLLFSKQSVLPVWVASVPDGHQRIEIRSGTGARQRLRCTLPVEPWFENAWRSCDDLPKVPPLAAHQPKLERYEHADLITQGLAFVKPGPPVTNLSVLSAESLLLKSYYHDPLDGAMLNVVGSVRLDQSGGHVPKIDLVECSKNQKVTNPKPGKFVCHAHFVDQHVPLAFKIASRHGLVPQASHFVRDVVDEPPRTVIVLPAPFAILLVRGLCNSFMWLARWSYKKPALRQKRGVLVMERYLGTRAEAADVVSLFHAFPQQECMDLHGAHMLPQQFVDLSASSLARMSQDLRHVAVQLQDATKRAGAQQDLAESYEGSLHVLGKHIDQLQQWSQLLSQPGAAALGDRPAKLKCRYSSDLLLHCVMAAFSSRGSDYMNTVRSVLRIALPLQLQPLANSIVGGLPKKSTVKRARACLDLAITLRQQVRSKELSPAHRLMLARKDVARAGMKLKPIKACLQPAGGGGQMQVHFAAENGCGCKNKRYQTESFCRCSSMPTLSSALGSGRAREVDKAAALAHMVCFVCESASDMERISQEVVSLTTDMGTEHCLSTCRVAMHDVSPRWWRKGELQEEEGVLLGAQAANKALDEASVPLALDEEADVITSGGTSTREESPFQSATASSTAFLPSALPIVGLEHIANNMTTEVHSRLGHWEAYHSKLHVLASFLTRRWRRERYIVTCLAETPLSVHAHQIREFSATLYEKRWHHAVLFIKQLWTVFPILQQTFSASKFTEGGTYGGDAEFNPETVQSICRDAFFGAYTKFVLKLDSVPQTISQWSKGCPCHEHLYKRGPSTAKRLIKVLCNNGACPLLGKRACELAAGRLEQLCAELIEASQLEGLRDHLSLLSVEETTAIIRDAAAARSHFELQMSIKLDHWKRLPWVLCGLSHFDSKTAQSIAGRALAMMQKNDVVEAHMPLTQPWLRGVLRSDLERFANGSDLDTLSMSFQMAVAGSFFTPVNETTIESRHALATRATSAAGNAGASVASRGKSDTSTVWKFCAEQQSAEVLAVKSSVKQLLDAMDIARDISVMPSVNY
eukprot:6491404-Amphidinium_carterae.6